LPGRAACGTHRLTRDPRGKDPHSWLSVLGSSVGRVVTDSVVSQWGTPTVSATAGQSLERAKVPATLTASSRLVFRRDVTRRGEKTRSQRVSHDDATSDREGPEAMLYSSTISNA
jgi:hypothetical protein